MDGERTHTLDGLLADYALYPRPSVRSACAWIPPEFEAGHVSYSWRGIDRGGDCAGNAISLVASTRHTHCVAWLQPADQVVPGSCGSVVLARIRWIHVNDSGGSQPCDG